MNHQDHMNLLRDGIGAPSGVWADLGSGTGAFTLALADLIGATGIIYSVDQDAGALKRQEQAMRAAFPLTTVHYVRADFTHKIELPPLDGVVMANALHFVRHKAPVLGFIRSYLKPDGRLILVEYNVDQGNLWVPYPLSYRTWETLAIKNGFQHTELLATVSSRFLREIYSALAQK
jgi:ubiquinone/menaquinone biosynthesis C-methylase UbiE